MKATGNKPNESEDTRGRQNQEKEPLQNVFAETNTDFLIFLLNFIFLFCTFVAKFDNLQKRQYINRRQLQMSKNILSLSANEAMDFRMKSEQYQGFELPEYFLLDKMFIFVKKKVGERRYKECIEDIDISKLTNVNFEIFLNKDYKFSVRPFTHIKKIF